MTTEWLPASIRVSGVLLGCVVCGSFLLLLLILLILLLLLLLVDYRACLRLPLRGCPCPCVSVSVSVSAGSGMG